MLPRRPRSKTLPLVTGFGVIYYEYDKDSIAISTVKASKYWRATKSTYVRFLPDSDLSENNLLCFLLFEPGKV